MHFPSSICTKWLKSVTIFKTDITTILLIVSITNVNAQAVKANTITVVNNNQPDAFPLVVKDKAATIFFYTADATVVRIAANLRQKRRMETKRTTK